MIIKITIDRIEGDKVVLKTDDNYMIVWPKDKLPNQTHEGMELVFEVEEKKEVEIKNKKLAKDIINEILDINS